MEASRVPEACVPFQLCKIDVGHLSLLKIIVKLFLHEKICGFWPASSNSCNWILQFFACTACPVNCDSLMELGQSSTSSNYSRFPEACLQTLEFLWSNYFGVLLLVHSRLRLSFANNYRFLFFDNFYHAFFQRRLVHDDGLDSVCPKSFLRCGQVNSVHCILLRSSMILIIHLPRFLRICNYFCFAGIVVGTNCTPPIVEEMFVFLLYECVHSVLLLYVLSFLLPVQLLW